MMPKPAAGHRDSHHDLELFSGRIDRKIKGLGGERDGNAQGAPGAHNTNRSELNQRLKPYHGHSHNLKVVCSGQG